jgi:mannose-1-phosphate guanylyltransferase / mannose-6-phosphate isomerase
MYAIILAGGSGTRLWPLSREQFPKQYLPLIPVQADIDHTANFYSRGDEKDSPSPLAGEEQNIPSPLTGRRTKHSLPLEGRST